MKIYCVGGSVRDTKLNLAIKDYDRVVVHSSPEEMIALGFKPVGKSFPVFLHPETHEEYALARIEKKVGRGYHGFTFYTDSSVSLEDDLKRRDLTINAMALDESGEIIDPHGGLQDLDNRLLRHVSDAYAEDPLRLFRTARFRAQLGQFNFQVFPATLELMRQLVDCGEIQYLSKERIFQETHRALSTAYPEYYFETLQACGALQSLLPNFTPPPFEALVQIKTLTTDPAIRFAYFAHLWFEPEALKIFHTSFCLTKRYKDCFVRLGDWLEYLAHPFSADTLLESLKRSHLLQSEQHLDLVQVALALTQMHHSFWQKKEKDALLEICRSMPYFKIDRERIEQAAPKERAELANKLYLQAISSFWSRFLT